jgi:dihydrofolate synthase/folylpolyglutamate synthase
MMAFLHFKRANVDFMVLEVGMGGRLDSTNIADSLISVITPISFDHTQHLGNTLRDIAFEKCGIIKNNSVVISSPQHPEAMDVIRKVCDEKKSKLYVVGRDIFFEVLGSDLGAQSFRLLTRYGEFPYLKIRLLGDFQIENAAAAVAASEELRLRGIFIRPATIKNGLAKARWSGRLELIHQKPVIVVDGAQDINSASRLKKAIKDIFKYRRLYLIFGTMRDKDIGGMCKELSGIADCAAATKSKSGRASPPEIIRENLLKHKRDIKVITTDSVAEALANIRQEAGEEDLILITGSLYVAAEAMEELRKSQSHKVTRSQVK